MTKKKWAGKNIEKNAFDGKAVQLGLKCLIATKIMWLEI